MSEYSAVTAERILVKTPGESKVYAADFAPLLEDGETIDTVSVSADKSGLTIASAAAAGSKVKARISGGTDGVDYLITWRAVTAAPHSNTHEIVGRLQVRAK